MTFRLYFLSLTFILLSSVSEAQQSFQTVFTTPVAIGTNGNSLCRNSDGSYTVAGSTMDHTAGSWDVGLSKFSTMGSLLWSKSFGGSAQDLAKSLLKTSDGGYLIAGTTQSFGAGGSDCWLVKTDSNGLVLWSYTYGNVLNETLFALKATNDGGYIMCGRCNDYNSSFITKTDGAGILQWSRVFDSPYPEGASEVIQTADSGYVVTGYCDTTYSAFYPVRLITILKTDAAGILQWSRSYVSGSAARSCFSGACIDQTGDGGYMLFGGRAQNLYWGPGCSFVAKLDSAGVCSWSTFSNDFHVIKQLLKTEAGDYILSGDLSVPVPPDHFHPPGSYPNAFLLEMSPLGSVNWARQFGSDIHKISSEGLCATPGSGYAFTGTLYSSSDLILFQTDSSHNTTCDGVSILCASGVENLSLVSLPLSGSASSFTQIAVTPVNGSGGTASVNCYTAIDETEDSSKPTAFPNPGTGKFYFTKLEHESSLEIYEGLGKIVYVTKIRSVDETVDISGYPKGLYFYRIIGPKGNISSGKIILE